MEGRFESDNSSASSYAVALLKLVDTLFDESADWYKATTSVQAFIEGLLRVTSSRGAALCLDDTVDNTPLTVTAFAADTPPDQWLLDADDQTDIDSRFASILRVRGMAVCNSGRHGEYCICGELPISRESAYSCIVLPIVAGKQKFGALALIGCAGGYDQPLTALLSSVCQILANQLVARWERRRALAAERDARTSERRYQALLDSTLDCFIVIDPRGMIKEFNAAAETTFGWRKDEVVHRSIVELVFPDQQRIDSFEKKRRANNTASTIGDGIYIGRYFETEARRKNGEIFPLEIACTKTIIDGQLMLMSVSRDITERQRQNDELRAVRDKAVRASKTKSRLVATVSHELRTPLTAVRGALELLEYADLTSQESEMLRVAQGSTEDLLTITGDLLDLSKIEAGKFELNVIDVRPVHLISGILKLMGFRARQTNTALIVFVDPEVPDIIRTDSGRVRQVLINLMENSIRNAPGGNVSITVDLDEERRLRFSVTDDGPGISEQHQGKLFQDFSQVGPRSADTQGGSGMGLSISKKIVQQFGGDIGLTSRPGEDCNFWFSIPINSPVPEKRQLGASGEFSHLKVLFVGRRTPETLGVFRQMCAWGVSARFVGSIKRFADRRLDSLLIGQVDLVVLCLSDAYTERAERAGERCRQIGARSVRLYAGRQGIKTIGPPKLETELHCPVGTIDLYHSLCAAMGNWPAGDGEGPLEAVRPGNSWDFTGVRLLFVSDSQASARVMSAIFSELGMLVDVARGGRTAVDKVGNNDYDVVMMGIDVPEIDGFTAAKMIRSLPEQRGKVPIAGFSGETGPEIEEKCRQAGMDILLSPVSDRGTIFNALADLLQENRLTGAEIAAEPVIKEIDLRRTRYWFDSDTLDRLARDTSDDMMQQMVEVFVEELRQQAQVTAAAVKDSDIQSLKTVSHIMKNSAQTFGAQRVSNLAVELNSACRKHDTEYALELAERLLNEITPSIWAFEEAYGLHERRAH